MADHTGIEWTDATWNPVTGCSVVSPGCTNCYAMRLAGTRLKHVPSRQGLTRETKAGPVWTGEVRLNEQWLDQPLRWRRPRRIFVCAHGDLFAENVPDEWIDRVFAVMALSPQHTFQVLTKRSKRMRDYVSGFTCEGARRFHVADAAGRMMENGDEAHDYVASGAAWPLPNVWLGVSAERQQEADERIPDLLATPAAIRFVSAEPLLGPIDFTMIPTGGRIGKHILCGDALRGPPDMQAGERLDWIVVGGESGPDARPMHPAWARSIRDQCAAAGVAFFFKQWGEWAPLRSDLIPTPNERQAWVRVDGEKTVRAKVSADLDALEREEDRAGRPLYAQMLAVGKKRAGRLLDGVEHNGFPEIREVPFG